MSAYSGRLLLVGSTLLSAVSAAHKRRCLSRRPADPLVLNTTLSALHLLVGLILAPPMLLVLCGRPVRETLVQLARGLRCTMSGFSAQICGDNRDAFGTPALLSFFIASTFWSAASYFLLAVGGDACLAVGSALVLPGTLFAFIRPFPLPYAWAAPPEPFSPADMRFATALMVALVV